MSEIGEVTWNARLEAYFAASGEKAHALSMLHKRAESVYSYRRTLIDLPVIVGSGVIGFLNAGSQSMFSDPMISSVALGVGSLVVGILQTINTYFAWAKRAEGHRIASIQYGKLYRYLSIEMALPREERKPPSDLLSHTRETFDRLTEISPLLPDSVVKEFKVKFKDYTNVARPEETNGLEKIEVYVDNPMRVSSPQNESTRS